MKKLLFLTALAAFSTGLFGQKIMLSLGALTNDVDLEKLPDLADPKASTGFFGGLRMKANLPGPLFFAPAAQVSLRGTKTKTLGVETISRNLHTDLHAMLGLNLSIFSIEAGLFGSAPITEQVKFGDGDWQKPAIETLAKFDWGGAVGAELKLGKIGLFGRYNLGLGDHWGLDFTDTNGQPITDARAENRFLQFGLNLRLN